MPTQPATPKTLKPFPSFETFYEEMKRYLDRVLQNDVDRILRLLYRAAKIKVQFEERRLVPPEDVEALRSDRKKLAKARVLINEALKLLANVDPDLGDRLAAEQQIGGDTYLFPLADMVQFLTDAAENARTFELAYVAWVHPDLRDATERRLAKERIPGEKGSVGDAETYLLPASPLSKAVNHWFMGVAAKCLDQGRNKRGEKITNHKRIIAKVFEVAFGDFMTTESAIEQELKRQKKKKKKKKKAIQLAPLNSEDERWLSTLGQKSTRNRSPRKKLSGQKRKK